MTDMPIAKVVGTVLLVSLDALATRQLTEAMEQLALSVEVCLGVSCDGPRELSQV